VRCLTLRQASGLLIRIHGVAPSLQFADAGYGSFGAINVRWPHVLLGPKSCDYLGPGIQEYCHAAEMFW